MGFDLGAELAAVRGQGYELHGKYLNPQMPNMLHMYWVRRTTCARRRAYLFDAEGNAYADFLSGFGVFAARRSHPVIKKALQDALAMDFAAWTESHCQPIMGASGEEAAGQGAWLGAGVLLLQRHRGG